MQKKPNSWTYIPGYEGIYQVHPDGSVRSLDRKYHPGRILSKCLDSHGYHRVLLYKDKKAKNHLVHRLVALTFLGGDGLMDVNHKDAVKTNNSLDNLEWCTKQDNMSHAIDNGLIPSGQNCHKAKLTVEQVRKIRESSLSSRAIAKLYDITQSNVCIIRRKESWKNV